MSLAVVTGASGFVGGVLVAMPLADGRQARGGSPSPLGLRRPRLGVREALHALESDPSVARPLVESVEDTYRWFQDRATLDGAAS